MKKKFTFIEEFGYRWKIQKGKVNGSKFIVAVKIAKIRRKNVNSNT